MKKIITLIIIVIGLNYLNTNAQIDIKGKLKNKTNNKANNETDKTIDNGLNKATDGVKNLFKKKKSDEKSEEKKEVESKKEIKTEPENKPEANSKQVKTEQPSLKSYSKYDFIPGEQIIYYDDFSYVNLGDFPDKWNTNSSAEAITLNNYPGKWLSLKGGGTFYPESVTKFSENFTLEFDMISSYSKFPNCLEVYFIHTIPGQGMDGAVSGKGGFALKMNSNDINIRQWKQEKYDNINQYERIPMTNQNGKLIKLSIWVQKQRVRLYYEGNKIFDIPKMMPTELILDRLRFDVDCREPEANIYVSNIRLAEAAPDMRSKLITEGKLVTHGIYFDSGSDVIKAESYGTLKGIANTLNENPAVKVRIIGHTDSDGGDVMNLELSKKRAASVKNALTTEFAIEASRMETDGKGMSVPVSPNTTNEGKANNRRVEFIKL